LIVVDYSLTIIFDLGLLPLKTLPCWAVCVPARGGQVLTCKLGGILTYFQGKVKKKSTTDEHGLTQILMFAGN
jgi:hypothetical protein